MNKEFKKYMGQVRNWLPCSRKLKNKIASDISSVISGYLVENPSADFSELQLRFGTPQQIAAAHVDEMDTQALLHDLHIKNKIVKLVTIGIVLITLVWAVTVTVALIDELNDDPGFYGEAIINENQQLLRRFFT